MPAPNLGLVGAGGVAGVQGEIQKMVAEQRAAEKFAFDQEIARRRAAVDEQNAATNLYEALSRGKTPQSLIQMTGLAALAGEAPGAYKGLWNPATKQFDTRQLESPDAQSSSSAEFERFLDRVVRPKRKAEGLPDLTPDEVVAWKKKYGQADDAERRDFMTRLFQTGSDIRVWNPNTGEWEWPKGPDGQPTRLPLPATAEQRNVVAAGKRALPVLQSISTLADRINTGEGLVAKAMGEVEKAKAWANYNDDLAEYNSIIKLFTPIIARAVGHTGVLTEPDVQSAREMFPKAGDSKTLKDRKIERLVYLLDSISGAGADEPPTTRPPGPGTTPPPGPRPGGGRTGPENEQQVLDQLPPYTNRSFVPVQKDGIWWGKDERGGWVQVSPDGKYIIGR